MNAPSLPVGRRRSSTYERERADDVVGGAVLPQRRALEVENAFRAASSRKYMPFRYNRSTRS